ncbi:hypothetical protein RCO28_32575 [Streptomyces sp. LHD-70]|uniref:hypothetical protein n=1 Tax=Streptomyces sp. LHD-70 TaxID=3072140 RepID=UPI00280CEC99|nr:hypothetical protein [Streptomyces sp. LHD-70]MDQ8707168.1 hypothetical protein [Streptomyces sp. LHD-70]
MRSKRGSKSKETREGRAESGRRDVEELLDELYVTPPPDFVARRGELAAAAKADGRPEDARVIRAARRPTLAGWAANLLLRSEPADCERFLALGQALREAYRSLDADEIKQLSGRRSSVVAAMSRQAVSLAGEAGHPLSDGAQQDVVSTLRAVLADQESADRWAAGRLESALTPPSDFPSSGATGTTGAAAPREQQPGPKQRTRRSARSTPGAAPVRDELAERRRRREQEQHEAARKAAEDAAAEADQALARQRADEQDADAVLEQARDRHTRAREQVSEAERQLEAAREALERAERAQRNAEERAQASADAAARAERDARRAAAEAERLRE